LTSERCEPQAQRAVHRREVLALGLGAGAGSIANVFVRPAFADAAGLQAAIRGYAGNATVRAGKVHLNVAPLVENGNTVPITVTVDSPMSADDRVTGIAVFNERNPNREVAAFQLGPRSGRATVSTRIRLATSQQLVALARLSDGTVWSHTVDVVVTLAACIE
jgi:sulfur-oxidizing protein SoxY